MPRDDMQLAPIGHGIARIHRQVEKNLFELAGVGLDPGRRPVVRYLQGDSRADETPQHPFHVAHDHLEIRSEEHTSELQSHSDLVCRLLLEKKKKKKKNKFKNKRRVTTKGSSMRNTDVVS